MSATTIAAARHERQDKRAGVVTGIIPRHSEAFENHADYNGLLSEGIQDGRLREALLGTVGDRHGLALPKSATFAELSPASVSMPLSGKGVEEFASHTVYKLPRDTLHDPGGACKFDLVHRFDLLGPDELNDGLRRWALHREKKCYTARNDILARKGIPAQIGDVGKVRSNRGGYQSHPNLFEQWIRDAMEKDPSDPATRRFAQRRFASSPVTSANGPLEGPRSLAARSKAESAEVDGWHHIRELHRLTSEALDQLCRDASADEEMACARVGYGTLRDAAAWVNVNRADDLNRKCMFEHTC
jgi:hypothetical protein